jgi:fluoride exporter
MAMTELRAVLIVGCGGFIGSAGRYLIGGWAHRLFPTTTFPVGTLVVNAIGCFAIGLLSALFEGRQLLSPEARLFLMIGILGGFTTFSSFAYETLGLARDGDTLRATWNLIAQVGICMVAAWVGYAVVRQ